MFSYQMWAAEDPACQPACVSGGEERRGGSLCSEPATCCLALKQNIQLAVPWMAQPGLGWPRFLIPGLWLWNSSGEQRAALGCPARNPQRGFPSVSPPNLLLLCSLVRRNKSPGSPLFPSSCGVMWAATSWAMLCRGATARRGWK